MSTVELLRLLEIAIWPAVAICAIFVLRPHLSELLSGARIKLSIFGQIIETTLPELKQVLEEQAGGTLTDDQLNFLTSLKRDGAKQYPSGIDVSADRKFLRPLRNAGLILAIPRNAFLQEAKGIELSGLGRLFLGAKDTDVKRNT